MANNQSTRTFTDAPPLQMSPRRRWAVTVGIMTGMFLAALESTVIGTAMPMVVASLGGLNHFSWVFSAYLITSTVTVPVWGKLSDLYGRRLFYQTGIALFLLGSVLSGLSTSMVQLIVFRAIQGLGAGALIPLGMTIIGDIYTLRERAGMQAYFSGVWGVASVVGPVVGGFLTDQLSWRWVFFINLPFGIAAALIMGFALQEPKRMQRPAIDYAGAILLMASMTMLMLGLMEGDEGSVTLFTLKNLLYIMSSAILLALFIWNEKRAADPMLPLQLFSNRVFSVAVTAGFLAGVSMFAVVSFLPLFAQGAMGASATQAGSFLTPLMLSWVSMSVVGGRLMLRTGFRATSISGFVLLTLGFVLLSTYERRMAHAWLYFYLVLIGSGLGLAMLTLLIAVQQSVVREQLGVATSLNQFARSIGGAIGVAIMGVVLTSGLNTRLAALARDPRSGLTPARAASLAAHPDALVDPIAQRGLSPGALDALQEAMAGATRNVFWAGAALAGLALVAALYLPRKHSDSGL